MANVDLDKLTSEITEPPPEVSRFSPSKYRTPTTLSQWTNDMRRRVNEIKQLCDDMLRDLG